MNTLRTIVSRLLLLCSVALCALPASRAGAGEASPYGVNIHAPQGEELTFLLDQVKAAGIGWVRIDFVWAYVETSQGAYDWSVYDAIAAAAQARGIEIYATLDYTPAWATSGPVLTGVPSNPQTWVDFCFAAAQRYRGKIRFWGMWNEPNLPQFWSGSRQQYLDLILKPGSDAIHAGNPDAQVGGPDLAHLTAGDADWYYWLQDTIDQAADKLDFVTHHIYDSSGNGNVTNDLTGSTLFANSPGNWTLVPPSVREVLKYTGWYPGKPVWLTETGWESSRVGEDRQATYYTGLLNDWYTGRSGQTWIGKIFFYEIKDSSDPGSSTWGLLRGDRTAKPAYGAYQTFIAQHQQTVDDALATADTFPTTLDTGQSLDATLTFQNNGTTTWTPAAGYTLGADNDLDPFTSARQPLAAGDAIAPGQKKIFTIHLQAPQVPGLYTVHWTMLREGGSRFGTTFTKQITVNAAPSPGTRDLGLLAGRFTIEVTWHDQHSGRAGYGRSVPSTDQTGFFWFFDPSNIELVVKVLDGRPVDGAFWVFYGALSDVEYWVTVTDTRTGKVKQYHNPPGSICGSADTQAFRSASAGTAESMTDMTLPFEPAATALPAASASGCVEDTQTLCLLNHRYRVSVAWHDQHNNVSGLGFAAPRTDQSGTFWFFDPSNVELVVKVLDGTLVNGKIWVFYGALTDVKYTITVFDTVTGARKQYLNKPGNICGKGDTAAF
ncbi:MAG TPA: NBR1-Ig-like domain-containing protein [Thermoanaerobaculia bacterium]|jgi:hypothetical protein|nr:NBR1-Ig-like domain-containing protein [Thermoanaerobaculia bacterium]